jgi:hypothetical protein
MRVEKLAFYLRLPGAAFGRLSFPTACRVAPLLVLAQVANAAGFAWEATRTLVLGRREELAARPELSHRLPESELTKAGDQV